MRISALIHATLISLSLLAVSCAPRPAKISFGDKSPKDDNQIPDVPENEGDPDDPIDNPDAPDDPDSTGNPDPKPNDPTKPGETEQPLEPFVALKWPADQVLPSFPAPAETQELVYLRTSLQKFEAEGKELQHGTGHLDGDGWLAEKDKDAPGHMAYGPYIKTLPTGQNGAEFSLKRLGAVGDNDEIAVLDVMDAAGKGVLGELKILGKDLPKENENKNFTVPFKIEKYGNAIETRVYFSNKVSIKLDWTGIQGNKTKDEMIMFTSLKGLVNRKQPRIFVYDGDAFAEGPKAWLDSFKMKYTEVSDNWSLVTKYKKEVKGLLVYDPDVLDTINLATTLATDKRALVVSPQLADTLSKEPYNLPVLESFVGKFKNKLEVYNYMYDTYWPKLNHRLLIGLNPDVHIGSLREYAVGIGVATIWLNPEVPSESPLLDKFLTSLDKGSTYLGWWSDEGAGITRSSQKNVTTIAADFATNLTFHSGMPREMAVKPIPKKPDLKNKIYVGFILSDGDNFQYIEHLMRKLWNNPARGKVPMGWTMSPATVDAMPGALNYYQKTATDNDNLISGPSGLGYVYPNDWSDKNALKDFVVKSEKYNVRAGFKVITIWNTIVGATSEESGKIYGENAPSLLGLTAQNTGGPISVFPNQLPNMPLSCNYCTGAQAMQDHIRNASANWNRNEPRFIMIQAQPWTDVRPDTFLAVKESLGADYEVVRPDHFFMLMREAKGLKKPTGTDY